MKYNVPVTANTMSSLRPHFNERLYCFAAVGFPNDSGEGGMNGWYRCCKDRMEILLLLTLEMHIVEGRCVCIECLAPRERVCEAEEKNFEEEVLYEGLNWILTLRGHSPAMREDISSAK